MYYVKWKGSQNKYLKSTELGCYPWSQLKEAKSFTSILEAIGVMGPGSGCMHWLALTEVVFIHPLNFEAYCQRDV